MRIIFRREKKKQETSVVSAYIKIEIYRRKTEIKAHGGSYGNNLYDYNYESLINKAINIIQILFINLNSFILLYSLQGDTCQKLPTMSENEFYNMDISSKKKKKNVMMLYCTTNGTNQLDNIDEQTLLKKKKKKTKMSASLKTHSHSESSSEKRRRKFWHRESMYQTKYSNRFPFSIL